MSAALKPAAELAAASAQPFPNDSAEYRAAREALLAEEVELRRHMERVSEMRRALPPGGAVTGDYRFLGKGGPATLAGLFAGHDTLIVYSAMFGPERDSPCPMCTNLVGGVEGNAADPRQRAGYAVVARGPIERLLAWGEERGWRDTPFYQDVNGHFTVDYHGRVPWEGETIDVPVLNVFARDGDVIRHSWGSEMAGTADPGQDPRGAPDIAPLWNMLDLTPEGRGKDWYPKLRY